MDVIGGDLTSAARAIGVKQSAPVDVRERERQENEAQQMGDRRQRIAEAGGQLVTAALRFLGELLPRSESRHEIPIAGVLREQLGDALDTDTAGRPVL